MPCRAAVLSRSESAIPHVTAIRPCKGLEPYLYECLEATLQQDYPRSKLTVSFCVSSKRDLAYPTIQRVLAEHPNHDAKVFIEEDDPRIHSAKLGPNPKIRNMSRAYREAKGDIVWIIDCNVWVNPGACARMVDKLCGYRQSPNRSNRPYKLVHHLPISVDVPSSAINTSATTHPNGRLYDASTAPVISESLPSPPTSTNAFGGRLEELFLSSSHAKMYVAINSVAIAPCIVGKSTMFRRSHLNSLTSHTSAPAGIDFFSHNICEDHLIGDLLWRSSLPNPSTGLKYRNHGLVLGDLAIQPVASMSVSNYIARRVRWLRVRKFTVPAATLVEPGTESMLCSAMGAWGITTSEYTREWAVRVAASVLGGDAEKWRGWWALIVWWVGSMVIWGFVDWTNYLLLHSGATIEESREGVDVPAFARTPESRWASSQTKSSSMLQRPWNLRPRRKRTEWAKAWLGREILALPIWLWAIWGGVTVTWRERRFWVGWDMKVHEIVEDGWKKGVGAGPEAIDSNDYEGADGTASPFNGYLPSTLLTGDVSVNMNGGMGRKRAKLTER